MSNWKINGKRGQQDIRKERVGAGTIGGEHIVPRSLASRSVITVVDDRDPLVQLQYSTEYGLSFRTGYEAGGSSTVFTETGMTASLQFKGSSIGVMGRTGGDVSQCTLEFLIDNVPTRGRLMSYGNLNIASYPNNPVEIDDTELWVDNVATTYDSGGGYVMIDREVVQYTSYTLTNTTAFGGVSTGTGKLTGLTRGADGSQAAEHLGTATVFKWGTQLNIISTDISLRRVLWWNPFLEDREHVVEVRQASGTGFALDGFLLGGLIGQDQIALEYGSIALTSTDYGNTDANGTVNIGTLATRTGATIIGILGMYQTTPDPFAGNDMMQLMIKPGQIGGFFMYLVNGPTSGAWSVQIFFTYIGETL